MKNILLVLMFCASLFAQDDVIEVVNKGLVLPKILVQDSTTNFSDSQIKERFSRMILGDLKVGSAFDVLDTYEQAAFDDTLSTNNKNVNFILRYELSMPSKQLDLRVKLFSIKDNSIVFEKKYSQSDSAKWPFLSHRAVADMARALKLSPIEWMDKSIIISQYTTPGESKIIIADYTLNYQKVVLENGLNIFPKWANDAQNAFYYTSYVNHKPTLYRYDLQSNEKTFITSSNGMLSLSDVSKDGTKLLITMAPYDQSDIYLYDINSKTSKRITTYSGIDVNGNFIENDTRIVFVSDRLGNPNIFATNLNGTNVEQLVYHGKNNNSVSTWKNYIVYSSRESQEEYDKTTFNLYLISTQSDYIRQLTANGKNTFPRFSSDGGSIIYIKDASTQSAVGIIRVNENRSFSFPLNIGKLQSIDW